jgi:phage terminase large subunit
MQGGTSSGKTYGIIQYLFWLAAQSKQVITIVGQDLPNLKVGAMRDAANIVANSEALQSLIETFNKSNSIYYMKNGSEIEFKSYKDEQDAKSGKRNRLFLNEANGISWEIFQQLDIRTTHEVILDYNPSSKFWVHDKLIGHDNVQLYISNYLNNPFLLPEVIQNIEVNKPKPNETDEILLNWWNVYGLGKTGVVSGQIIKRVYDTNEFPSNCIKVAYGLDFGFSNDPTALIKCGLYEGEIYAQEVIYEAGLLGTDIERLMIDAGVRKSEQIFADVGGGGDRLIAELSRKGWNVKAAEKGAGSIEYGIDLVNRYRLNIVRGSKNLKRETERYIYRSNGKPIDNYNHAIDSVRYYALMMLDDSKVKPSGRSRSATI